MAASYYTLWFRMDGRDRYALWYTNDRNGVVLDDGGAIRTFTDIQALEAFGDSNGVSVSTEAPNLHDLDIVQRWLDNPSACSVDCAAFLNAWNLIEDLARSAGIESGGWTGHLTLYDKLFWGNNLPAVTPPGQCYVPEWTDEDVVSLCTVMGAGFDLFRSRLRP